MFGFVSLYKKKKKTFAAVKRMDLSKYSDLSLQNLWQVFAAAASICCLFVGLSAFGGLLC